MAKRYGPYPTAAGHLFYVDVDGRKRKSVLVHREIMENAIGRKLRADEVIHHKNEDPSDNRLENLEIMTPRHHAQHHHAEEEIVELVCIRCTVRFTRPARDERHNRNTLKTNGPFCGHSCAGKWSRAVQLGRDPQA